MSSDVKIGIETSLNNQPSSDEQHHAVNSSITNIRTTCKEIGTDGPSIVHRAFFTICLHLVNNRLTIFPARFLASPVDETTPPAMLEA